ncbi:N-acetyltransferase family protein [Ferruginibacter sp. SUN002]|uniref:GNAT family N-acetyltransferase n=1 Tax=Ferruginibacter sp. SUN002 TaxID=2937789 RepID=UPI003D368603
MNIIIRQAVKEDCAAMMQLVHELAIYEKAPNEVTIEFDHFVESGFGANPVWWALVADVDGMVKGFALWYVRFSTWKGQRMFLEDLLVTEDMRGQGIGRLLFDELIKVAKEKKYSGIAWQVLDWNEPAINFYKKLGDVSFDGEWVNCALPIV